MQWSLFLLILTGQCFFVMCQLYQYKFIRGKKNWTDAQSYCRSQYIDLATVYDLTDMTRMQQPSEDDAWIGLYSEPDVNTWKWSDGSSSHFKPKDFITDPDGPGAVRTARSAPGSGGADHTHGKCVSTESGQWHSKSCDDKKSFFCYEDKMILIKEEKTWEEALDYCREKHHDLVSITNQKQEKLVQQRVKRAGTNHEQEKLVQQRVKRAGSSPKGITEFIWLGLRYTCTLDIWFWVNGEVLNLDNWNSTQSPTQTCYSAAAMQKVVPYKWVKKMDHEKFSFICV